MTPGTGACGWSPRESRPRAATSGRLGETQQERALDSYFRRRGVYLPAPPSDTTAQNLYVLIGIFICLFEAGRIWFSLTP